MRNKKTLFIVIIAIIIALSIFSIIRINFLNSKYPDPIIVEHKIGEVIDGGGISIRIIESELINGNEFEKTYPGFTQIVENADGTVVEAHQYKFLSVSMDIKNKTKEKQIFSVAQLVAETSTWSNGINVETFSIVNKDKLTDPQYIELEANQNKIITITYEMFDFQYEKDLWNNIKIDDFDLSLSQYPVKHIIRLIQ